MFAAIADWLDSGIGAFSPLLTLLIGTVVGAWLTRRDRREDLVRQAAREAVVAITELSDEVDRRRRLARLDIDHGYLKAPERWIAAARAVGFVPSTAIWVTAREALALARRYYELDRRGEDIGRSLYETQQELVMIAQRTLVRRLRGRCIRRRDWASLLRARDEVRRLLPDSRKEDIGPVRLDGLRRLRR